MIPSDAPTRLLTAAGALLLPPAARAQLAGFRPLIAYLAGGTHDRFLDQTGSGRTTALGRFDSFARGHPKRRQCGANPAFGAAFANYRMGWTTEIPD